MWQTVHRALNELDLDYMVTMIAGGEKRNYEVIFFDKRAHEYFTIRVSWLVHSTADSVKESIINQLRERLNALHSNQTGDTQTPNLVP